MKAAEAGPSGHAVAGQDVDMMIGHGGAGLASYPRLKNHQLLHVGRARSLARVAMALLALSDDALGVVFEGLRNTLDPRASHPVPQRLSWTVNKLSTKS